MQAPLVMFGFVTSGWWSRLSPNQQALSVLASAMISAAGVGWGGHALISEQRTLPSRVVHLERTRDSTGTRLARQDSAIAQLDRRAQRIEVRSNADHELLNLIEGRVNRTLCWVSRNSDPICLQ